MPSLKQDISRATNLLISDSELCSMCGFITPTDKAQNIVPMRQTPDPASEKPLINLYTHPIGNLGYNLTSDQLVVDIYAPLALQRSTGIVYDIARRVKEVLDRKPIGRGLRWYSTDPDRRSTTGWHKATVVFTFQTTQF